MLAVSFTLTTARDLAYLVAIAGFIFALKGLSSPRHARLGNLVGAAAATLAIGMTFTLPSLRHSGWNLVLALIAMALGAAIAVPVARYVKMTAMPQLVAIFNGVGGGAAALISIVELLHLHSLGLQPAVYVTAEVLLGVLIGSVSFSGSAIAFIKLQELITGRPITYPGQQVINALVGAAIGVMVILALVTGSIIYVWVILVLALVLGVIFVLPIGGADVPVLISLAELVHRPGRGRLGLRARLGPADRGRHPGRRLGHHPHPLDEQRHGPLAAQHPLQRLRLGHHRHRRRRGRRLPPGAGRHARRRRRAAGLRPQGRHHPRLRPGGGPGAAHGARAGRSAQGARRRDLLRHPPGGGPHARPHERAAGRGQRALRRAKEMDEANPEMSTADVALVVGANDTVNPAAKSTPGSPIFGMPIIHADEAENIIFLKRSMRPGFAGIDNELLYDPKTTMLFGDAKDTLQKLVAAVNDA